MSIPPPRLPPFSEVLTSTHVEINGNSFPPITIIHISNDYSVITRVIARHPVVLVPSGAFTSRELFSPSPWRRHRFPSDLDTRASPRRTSPQPQSLRKRTKRFDGDTKPKPFALSQSLVGLLIRLGTMVHRIRMWYTCKVIMEIPSGDYGLERQVVFAPIDRFRDLYW